MLKTLLLGVAALALVGGVAYAENAATGAPQANVQVAQADDNDNDASGQPAADGQQDGNGGGWWQWHHGWRHNHDADGDHGGPGMMGQGGPGMHGGQGGPGMHGPGGPGMMMGMMRPHNGFKLHLGKGIDVAVACGKESIKDCIADAQPLIDAAKATASAQVPAPAKP